MTERGGVVPAHAQGQAVVFLLGATATGKTELAARLQDALASSDSCHGVPPVELVSVDAAQVYRGMDIGTAKPTPEFLRAHPHHLIDIRAPSEAYSAAQFCIDARTLISQIHARGNLPLLVGGSMFYFSALEKGLSVLPSADAELRTRLADEIKTRGLPALYAELQAVDAHLAARLAPTDRQRIQRALEIYHLTGRAPSAVMAESRPANQPPFAILKLGLYFAERSLLRERIAIRFRDMLARGLVEETRRIADSLENFEAQPALRTVGYRQVLNFLRGEYDYETMVEKGITATRRFAKRQLTWMRGWQDLHWLENTAAAGGTTPNESSAYTRALELIGDFYAECVKAKGKEN